MFEIRPRPNCVSRKLLICSHSSGVISLLRWSQWWSFCTLNADLVRPPTVLSVGSNFAILRVWQTLRSKNFVFKSAVFVEFYAEFPELFSVQFDCPCTPRDGIRKMLIWAPVQFCWAVQKFDEKFLKPNNKQFDALHSCGQNDVKYLLISCLVTISN